MFSNDFFTRKGEFYHKAECVAMGSPLSQVVTKLNTDKLEQRALEIALLNPKA